jgi:hypothetical protein
VDTSRVGNVTIKFNCILLHMLSVLLYTQSNNFQKQEWFWFTQSDNYQKNLPEHSVHQNVLWRLLSSAKNDVHMGGKGSNANGWAARGCWQTWRVEEGPSHMGSSTLALDTGWTCMSVQAMIPPK